jgi:hypothetical protein
MLHKERLSFSLYYPKIMKIVQLVMMFFLVIKVPKCNTYLIIRKLFVEDGNLIEYCVGFPSDIIFLSRGE